FSRTACAIQADSQFSAPPFPSKTLHHPGGIPSLPPVSRPVDSLIEFLRAEEARGVTTVHLDDGAKSILRELHQRAKESPVKSPARPAAPAPETSSSTSPASAEEKAVPRPAAAPAAIISPPADGSAAMKIAA